jgi:hypothetical protein
VFRIAVSDAVALGLTEARDGPVDHQRVAEPRFLVSRALSRRPNDLVEAGHALVLAARDLNGQIVSRARAQPRPVGLDQQLAGLGPSV